MRWGDRVREVDDDTVEYRDGNIVSQFHYSLIRPTQTNFWMN
jgi:hypothetical protein